MRSASARTSLALPRESLTVGFLFNLLGRAVTVVGGGLVSILLARHFQAEVFGQWAVASVYATLVGTVVDGGLARLLIRDVARDPPNAGRALGRVLKGRSALGLVVVPAALSVAAFQVNDLAAWVLVLLLVVARFVTDLSATFTSALFAFDRFKVPNLIETARRLGMVIAAVIVVVVDLPIHWAAVATLALAFFGLPYVVRETRSVLELDFSQPATDHARDAFWFWVSGIFFWINGEIDQLMLSNLAGDRVTGIYAAAVRLVALFYIIPRAVNDTVIRRMFKSAKDGVGLNRQMNATVLLLAGLGTTVGIVMFAHGPQAIELLYGPAYRESGPVFATYGLFLAVFFVRIAPSWYLSSSDRVPLVTAYLAFACILNISANLYWIPRAGAQGAAYSTLLSELALAGLCVGTSLWLNGRKLLYSIALGVGPGGVALVVEGLSPATWPWWLRAGLSGGAGLLGLAALGIALRRGWNPFQILSDQTTNPCPPGASETPAG